jgi:uncharacterized protein YwbE
MLRGNHIAMSAYIINTERSQINNQLLHFKLLEKEEQAKSKITRRGIIKLRAKRRGKKPKLIKVEMKKGTNANELQRIIKEYCDSLLKTKNLDQSKLNQEHINYLNRSLTRNEIEAVLKNLPKKKSSRPDGCPFEIY